MESSTSASSSQTIDGEKLQQFMGKVLSDFGGAASCVLAYIGDKLGLYKAMSDFGKPITSQELANSTGTSERYIREWSGFYVLSSRIGILDMIFSNLW